jgi:predicted ATPase
MRHGFSNSTPSAFLALVLFCLGYPDQALERSSAAVAKSPRLTSLAGDLATGIRLRLLVGNSAVLGDWVDRLVAVTTEHGFPQWRALETICRGWIKVKNGDVAEGILLLRSGLAASHTIGAWRPHNTALLAAACEIAGQVDEALSLMDEALHVVERTGERWLAAELTRHKGQLLQRQGHDETADELFHKALCIAEEQKAKLFELRASTSLARLWRDQGKRTEARDLLAPIYVWFTEGFDTPDLKEAKALLDELAL